jgi:pilus assembly protein CpaB
MRRSNLLILFVAIGMGVIAAFMVGNWLQNQARGAAPQKTATIVVAAAPLGFGTTITEDKVLEIPWAATSVPEGAFATKTDLLKDGRRVVLAPVDRNEPLLRSKITAPGQRGALSSLLEEGKRAVTVRVDDVRGVAGFILPGDRVDVVLIRTEGNASGGQSYSDIILQNVKVLAVDQLVNERPDQASLVAKAVTLEVTADQSQKVALATNIGKLSLSLRQAGEDNESPARRVTEKDLGVADVPPKAAEIIRERVVEVPVRRSTSTVTIVRGDKREDYPVLPYQR